MSKPRPQTPELSRDAGVALVIVLWLIVVLALQVGLLNRSMRDGVNIVKNATAIARGQALMHAGMELAVSRLTSRDVRTRWPADGNPRSIVIAGTSLTLTITDENGRINLNTADAALIRGLLQSLALGPADATLITDRILDWRDPDHERRRRGAEDADYKRAGLEHGAADQPFHDTSDLVRVLGMSREIADLLTPHVTIYTNDGRVNPRFASRHVLAALPELRRETVEQAFQMFRKDSEQALVAEALLAPAGQYLGNARGPAYRIHFEVRDAGRDAIGSGEAVVALGLDSALPYRTLSWRFSPSMAQASESVGRYSGKPM